MIHVLLKIVVLGSVHSTRKKFENGVFILKTHQKFSVHTTVKKLKTQQSSVILDLCLKKTRAGKSHGYPDVLSFSKTFVFKMFSATLKRKAGVFQISLV